MKYLNKSMEDFDNYEKYAFQLFDNNLELIESYIDIFLSKVHFKDKWDLFVYVSIKFESEEYASNLLVVPSFMDRTGDSHRKKCTIPVDQTMRINGRSYRVLFDCYD